MFKCKTTNNNSREGKKGEKTIGKKENRIRAYMLVTDIITTIFLFCTPSWESKKFWLPNRIIRIH